MNREQIIQMAKDCGGSVMQPFDYGAVPDRMILRFDNLERFAAAIRAATKEEDAKICEEEIESWERATSSCVDEKTALRIAAKEILASK